MYGENKLNSVKRKCQLHLTGIKQAYQNLAMIINVIWATAWES